MSSILPTYLIGMASLLTLVHSESYGTSSALPLCQNCSFNMSPITYRRQVGKWLCVIQDSTYAAMSSLVRTGFSLFVDTFKFFDELASLYSLPNITRISYLLHFGVIFRLILILILSNNSRLTLSTRRPPRCQFRYFGFFFAIILSSYSVVLWFNFNLIIIAFFLFKSIHYF